MSLRTFLRRFGHNRRGAGAAEFALILPVFLLFFLGMIDAGRFLYEVNRGEKATQIGARMAVVTDPIAADLKTVSYVGTTVGGVTLTQGDRIPAEALAPIDCNASGCSSFGFDAAAFNNLLDGIQRRVYFGPGRGIQASNLIVEYRGSGLGYAGNPDGMDIAPLVTVRLTGLSFSPILLFGGDVNLPDFSYALTMEDGDGTSSN